MIIKFLPVFLLAPAVLFGGEVKQQYEFPAPQIRDNAVVLDGCHPFYAPFVPSVPVKSVRLLLPDGETAVSYQVSYSEPASLGGNYSIKPYRPEIRFGAKAGAGFYFQKATAFRLNQYFPSQTKSGGFTVQYKGGHPIFMGQIYPVQYNPATGSVRYYRTMTVTVRTAAETSGASPSAIKTTPVIRDELAKLVDNKENISGLAAGAVTANDYEYLIVTTAALRNNFGDFVAFNTRRGMRTKIVTIDSVRKAAAGVDDQEKIRACIKQEHDNCNITYVLLAGDAEAASPNRVPDRKLFSEDWDYNYTGNAGDHYMDSIPADLYYGCLDAAPHDWKPTAAYPARWGYYGTEDVTFEVYVGRFPVDNASELATIIGKTIKYSEHPVDSLCTRALLAGEYLWGPPDHPVACYGDDEMDQLIGACNVSYGPLQGFPAAGWTITKLYDKAATWGFTDFVNALQSSKAAIIDHEGHANAYYLFKTSGSNMTATTFPQACTPSTGNYFVVMSGGCYPGAFDNNNVGSIMTDDCIAERLTVELPTGAVASIMNSRWGFGSDGSNGVAATDGSEQVLRRYFHHGLFGLGYHTIGRLDAYSKEVNADKWTDPNVTKYESYFGQLKWETYEKNIMGDPALSIWTDKPQALAPALPDPLTSDQFTITVPKYSVVALADPSSGAIIVSSTSGDGGSLTIQNSVLSAYLKAHPQGKLKVIIKAHNFYPYSGTMNVSISSVRRLTLPGGREFSLTVLHGGIRYTLASAGTVSFRFFDAKGAVVVKTENGMKTAGSHLVSFDDFGLKSGMYWCTATIDGKSLTEKVMVAR